MPTIGYLVCCVLAFSLIVDIKGCSNITTESGGCTTCIFTKSAYKDKDGTPLLCEWCTSKEICFDGYKNSPCSNTDTVTSAFSSRCYFFIGLPLVTGICVLAAVICCPLCTIVIAVRCVFVAKQVRKENSTATVRTVPRTNYKTNYTNRRNNDIEMKLVDSRKEKDDLYDNPSYYPPHSLPPTVDSSAHVDDSYFLELTHKNDDQSINT